MLDKFLYQLPFQKEFPQINSLEELPVNFTGILMQADEEYGNKVWDKHFGDLYTQLQSQKMYYQLKR